MRGTDISKEREKYSKPNTRKFPQTLDVRLEKEYNLKYGENPHQAAAMYRVARLGNEYVRLAELLDITSVRSDGKGKGGLSQTNMLDVTHAINNLKWFNDPAVVILKHNIVSGFACTDAPMPGLYRLARDSDRRSNFGGVVVFNRPLDIETAARIGELPNYITDVIAAPDFDRGVIETLEKKSKNVRIAEYNGDFKLPRFQGDDTYDILSFKEMPTGRVGVQEMYLTRIKSGTDLIFDPMVIDKEGGSHVVARDPTEREIKDLLTAWYLNITGARSNGVVFVRDGMLVSMGAGQVERVGAVEQALIKGIHKAFDREGWTQGRRLDHEKKIYNPLYGVLGHEYLKDNPFNGASCSSDAFFPFGDSIKIIGDMGVTAIAQPFGSVRDGEVIDTANEYNIAMPATLERCFGHW